MEKLLQLLCVFLLLGFAVNSNAQTVEEVEAMKTEKAEKEAKAAEIQAELDGINGEIASLTAAIDKTIKWRYGASGLLGFDMNNFNNWAQKEDLNSSAISASFAYAGFANLIEEQYFWRNNAALNFGWLKYDQDSNVDDPENNDALQLVADVFNAQSLFGYKLTSKLAFSVLGEFRSSLINNFNNPGYLDFGTGVTYNPIPNLAIVAHPFNYNYIFSKDEDAYTSSLGAKIVADYNTDLGNSVKWRSNLSAYLSYVGSDLSNYTWVNGISFTAFKGIGVGLELGLRWNPQESAARELSGDTQSYYTVGLSYTL